VGVFTDPIVVFPGGWGDTLPDWLKNAVTLERLEMNMKASLTQPMGHDWTQIYLYVAGRAHGRWNKGEMPEDIKVESLSDSQNRELNRLKEWLYRKRTLARQDGERNERWEKKEEEVARREVEQPALFGF